MTEPRSFLGPSVVLLLCAALGLLGCKGRSKTSDATSLRGTLSRLVGESQSAGCEVCDPRGAACARVSIGAAIPAGSVVRTGARVSAEVSLSDGSSLALDHDTELRLASSAGHARLAHGALASEIAGKGLARARIDVNGGAVELGAGKFALRAGSDFVIFDVLRGSARLSGESGNALPVAAGEEARWYRGSAPYVSAGAALAEAVAFTEDVLESAEAASRERGLGELTAKKPGSTEELRGAVQLATHSVRVRVAGAMARTEIDEVFENDTDQVLEGIFRFPVPTDAKIERLALEVDGKLEEGAFVDRDRAAAIWRGAIVHAAPSSRPKISDDIVWVPGPWRDPALLEWQRGGRFELRIFPIPKRGQRRIVLAYTQAVGPVGGVRRFTYSLPSDPGGTTKVRHFDFDLELRGNDPAFKVRALGYPLNASPRGDATALSLSANDFSPNGDLSVEWALPNQHSELSAFGYRSGDERYAELTLRPRLPRSTVDQVHATAIVVDVSRSMYGEGSERAKRLAVRLTRELDPSGPVSVLSCDSECRELPGSLQMPGPAAAQQTQRFLDGTSAEGASDLTWAIASAKRVLDAVPGAYTRDIVYIGDGTPTVGPIRVPTVTAAVRDALASSNTRVTAVAIGSGSDLETLGAIARAGGGLILPYVPGQTLNETALGVLSATYGSALRDVEVVLPEGLENAAPQKPDTLLAGAEGFIAARMTRDTVDGTLILRGRVGQAPFEQRYPLHLVASESAGNAFVPRVYAAARIADLEQNGGSEAKKEALGLSTRFSVASRYSSLLVLESEAMLQAFGIDKAEQASAFTGETVAEKSEAKGDVQVDEGDAETTKDLARSGGGSALGTAGPGAFDAMGSLGSMGAAAPPAAPRSAAKASRAAPMAPTDAEPRFAEPPAPVAPAAPSIARRPDPPLLAVPDTRPRQRMIPMRRVWDRKGQITTGRVTPSAASIGAVADAERALAAEPDRRSLVKKAYLLYAVSGDLGRASSLVERWSSKEPLDPDALTARADLAARRGDRELALRLLGSVVDVRPDDIASQKRLARLYRWSGRTDLGCRHAMAIAELRSGDARLMADALRCARSTTESRWASDALSLLDEKTARVAESLAATPAADDTVLSGDLRVEATWSDDADLDLALLHPDGHRVSWLGAPTRELISARDVLSRSREGLALSGAKPGQYVLEVVRSSGSGPVHGELLLSVAGESRRIPFTLDGPRLTLALADIRMVPRLVPLEVDDRRLIIGGVR